MARILALVFIIGFSGHVLAEERPDNGTYNRFIGFIFDTPAPRPTPLQNRPNIDDIETLKSTTPIKNVEINNNRATVCITPSPYARKSMMNDIGQVTRVMSNTINKHVEGFTFIPRFSGLKGPKITIMRKDVENALLHHTGSAQEIYHNAHIAKSSSNTHCKSPFFTFNNYSIIGTNIDFFESDRAPITRAFATWRNELSLGQNFIATASTRIPVYDNFRRETDLRTLTTPTPIRQDMIGYQYQGLNLEHLMASGFTTIGDGLHIAGHAGYLEEMFAGIGGEVLYRPYGENYSIGAEAWEVVKRIPYNGNVLDTDTNNRGHSALLNAWYDIPNMPISFGASAGKFLDGDLGIELKSRWSPQPGLRVEGFTTLSNQSDIRLDNDKTHLSAGVKFTVPLGELKRMNDDTHAQINFMPLARDKGQRIHNPYNLYDYTDPWSARNIAAYWHEITD